MKRLGKILKWIGISAGVGIAVLLMLNAFLAWKFGTQLEQRLADLRREGEPVQVADFAREPIPPEANADTFLRRAGDDLDAIQNELTALYPKSVFPTGKPSPADREKLEKLFDSYPKVMPLVEQAASCPEYDPQFDVTLPASQFVTSSMDRVVKHRTLCRVLRAHTALRLSQDRPDEALNDQILALRLARKWRSDPVLIGYLVTVACETVAMEGANQVLQSGTVSPASRQALDAELSLHDDLDGLRRALRSERACCLSSMREQFGAGSGSPTPRAFTSHVMLRFLDLFDHHIRDASRPYSEAASRTYAASAPRGLPNPLTPLVTLLEPSLAHTRQAAERPRALARALRVLSALQAREPAGDGAPALDVLGLPADATIDPFNGRPLHAKRSPAGWTVYSVGPDGVDDGGALEGGSDIGVGPPAPAKSKAPSGPEPPREPGVR
jgi:hypothetical protein